MNADQQQQQQQGIEGLRGTSGGNDVAIYANCNATTSTTPAETLLTSAPPTTTPTVGSTYVTISMMPAPPLSGSSLGTPGGGTTSTFKTPLLPMPTLEDIEGGVVGLMAAAPSVAPSHHHQPIPGGILKYPQPPLTLATPLAMTMPMHLPNSLVPGPPPLTLPPSTLSVSTLSAVPSQPSPQPSSVQTTYTTMVLSDAAPCGTLKSNAKLMQSTAGAATTAGDTSSIGVTNSGTVNAATSNNTGGVSNNILALASHRNSNTSAHNNANVHQSTRCCSCFGGSGGRRGAPTKTTKKRKSQHQQSLWSAILTNLGICALLLAYTLLGSFIFLTIESEDPSLLHTQRTLASTKRGLGSLAGGNLGAAVSGNGLDNTNNDANIYHTQQRQQQSQRQSSPLDNATMAAAATSVTAAAPSTAGSSSQSTETYLEGVNVLDMLPPMNNDFTYGDDVAAAAAAAAAAGPQEYGLAADTYDVRQRTIENIWDITVSLNILYKENWTKLAALEIAKFQDQLIKRLNEDALLHLSAYDVATAVAAAAAAGGDTAGLDSGLSAVNSPATEAVLLHTHHRHYGAHGRHEWNFAKAFLYSLTVLTTIGYGNIAPRTTLGRLVTLAYAIFGIPLTLVYLSSTGGILAKVAREVFSKALCCCLCSNCGYCCYDEKRMAEKERRTRRKRQQEELRKQQQAMQEPYYVRSGSAYQTPEKQQPTTPMMQLPPDIDSLSASESRGSMHGLSILAPILLCLSMMIIYIVFGAVVLYRLEEWPLLDSIYFCFMSLSTIGFGDMLPGVRNGESTTTTWFCSIYIMSGMALTAMCFNVIHEEIVHRIKIVVEFKKGAALDGSSDQDQGYYLPP